MKTAAMMRLLRNVIAAVSKHDSERMEPTLRSLVSAPHGLDVGSILDIVSNHMAVGGSDNPWWLDLLEWGRLSPYGEFFDIPEGGKQ